MTVPEPERRAAPERIRLGRLRSVSYFLRELALGQLRRRCNGARAFPRFEFAKLAVVPPIDFDFSREPEFFILSQRSTERLETPQRLACCKRVRKVWW